MAALGPLVGGWFVTHLSWRWAFYVNLPIALLALAGALFFVDESRDPDARAGYDPPGVVLSTLGFLCIVFGLIEGQNYGWWRAKQDFLGLSPVRALRHPVRVRARGRGARRLLLRRARAGAGGRPVLVDFALFRIPTFGYGNIAVLIVGLGELGLVFVIPLFLQSVLGLSAFDTGLVLVALAGGAFVAGGLAAMLTKRIGATRVVQLGLLLEIVGIVAVGLTFSVDRPAWQYTPPLFIYGLGVGFATAQLTSVILADVPAAQSGEGRGSRARRGRSAPRSGSRSSAPRSRPGSRPERRAGSPTRAFRRRSARRSSRPSSRAGEPCSRSSARRRGSSPPSRRSRRRSSGVPAVPRSSRRRSSRLAFSRRSACGAPAPAAGRVGLLGSVLARARSLRVLSISPMQCPGNDETSGLTRAGLLRRGALGGGVLLASASGLGALAPAALADAPPAGDLAYLRLLIAAELLAVDFYGQAVAHGDLKQQYAARASRISADEAEHYALLAALMTAAGQTPATSADIDFSYPGKTFSGTASVLRFAQTLETVLVGAYIDAVTNVETPAYRQTMAQILATEARHESAIAGLQGKPLVGSVPAAPLTMDVVSSFLGKYES